MILLLNKLGFSHHDHRHRHRRHRMSEVNLASLHAFRLLVSENLNRVLESLKLGSELLSLTWIHHCFQMVPIINIAFAKLMVEIDYRVASWEASSIDEYLDYTISLLDLLNSISSSISHVNQARVSLAHASCLMQSSHVVFEPVNEIKKHDAIMELKLSGGHDVDKKCNEKELIFHEAMKVLESIGFWVCGVVLSGLKGEVDPVMEIVGKMVSVDSSLMALDSIFKKKTMEKRGFLKEVEEVNESVCLIVSSGIDDSNGGMELKRRLDMVRNGLKRLKDEEELLFGTIMDARNEVLEILRRNYS
ncbi:hypothetical protein QVD17_16434 [Tagetes erecta]|uniref:Uncharacterized protein n=1 Tax=Tagetes erecta TaxID=13708 RepID=A0AAD8NTJ4_TARER|nr:hypothetical protein QVD17_16434 [Tagetes erecta]